MGRPISKTYYGPDTPDVKPSKAQDKAPKAKPPKPKAASPKSPPRL